jgi:hypothetical protein
MNSTTDKSSLDRTLGAGKPVDPATRLSELLAQSLEELTRPFDPPRPGGPQRTADDAAHADHLAQEPTAEQSPEESRLDADKALAELEAELFAAAKQVERDPPAEASAEPAADRAETPPAGQPVAAHKAEPSENADDAPNESDIVPPPLVPQTPEPKPDADAANVIAKVRKLMLVSMAVTVIAVGAVFGFVGYRMFKGEGTTAKTADKLPEASAIPADMTLALPRGARVIQSAVAGDRLVITLEADGRIEVRTFDVNTLQPAGRLNFSGTP